MSALPLVLSLTSESVVCCSFRYFRTALFLPPVPSPSSPLLSKDPALKQGPELPPRDLALLVCLISVYKLFFCSRLIDFPTYLLFFALLWLLASNQRFAPLQKPPVPGSVCSSGLRGPWEAQIGKELRLQGLSKQTAPKLGLELSLMQG